MRKKMIIIFLFCAVVNGFAKWQHCNVTNEVIHVSSSGQRYLKYDIRVKYDDAANETIESTHFCLVGHSNSPQVEMCYECSPYRRIEDSDAYGWSFFRWMLAFCFLFCLLFRVANE